MKIVKCHNGNIMMLLKEMEYVGEREIQPNVVDASFEKHIPQYEIHGNLVEVFVNHVMDEDHYIEWILIDYGKRKEIYSFQPGDVPKVKVEYQKGMRAYSYCNKHSLWATENF